jgi:hypothetical protein
MKQRLMEIIKIFKIIIVCGFYEVGLKKYIYLGSVKT